jgi:hypothetical protein
VHAAICILGIGEIPFLRCLVHNVVLRHGTDLVQRLHDEIGKRQLRRRPLHRERQHIRHPPVLDLHQLAERGKLGFQLRHLAVALVLQLLEHFLELSISSADLILDESRSFRQIIPDVTHGPLPAFR